MSALADIFAAVRLQLDGTGFEAQATALATKSGKNAGTVMSQNISAAFKKAAGGAIGAGLGLAFASATNGALELNAALSDFRAQTGASDEEAQAFGKSLAALNKSNVQGIPEIGAALTELKTNFNLTGAAAEASAAAFLDFARIAGGTAADSVLRFDELVDAGVVSIEGMSALMDQLTVSHQKFGVNINDTIANLVKFAPAMTAVNMTTDQALGLMNMFSEAGLNSAKATQAFNIALTKVKSPEELAALMADISATVDDFDRAQKAAALFGTRAGIQLANALKPGSGGLEAWTVSATEAAGATTKAGDALDASFGNRAKLILKEINGTLAELGTNMGDLLMFGALAGPSLTRWLSTFAGGIAGILGPMLVAQVAAAWTMVGSGSIVVDTAAATAGRFGALKYVAGFAAALAGGALLSQALKAGFADAAGMPGASLSDVARQQLADAGMVFSDEAPAVGAAAAAGFVDGYTSVLANGLPTIAAAAEAVGDAVTEPIDRSVTRAGRVIETSLQDIVDGFDRTWGELSAIANGTADAIYGPARRAGELAANAKEQQSQREIIASHKSTAAQKADARARLLALQQEGLGIRIEMAGRGELTKKAYDALIAELTKQSKSGSAEVAAAAKLALAKLAELREAAKAPIIVKTYVMTYAGKAKPEAQGGPVQAGHPYIVGDGGRPELFVPEVDGRILPSVPAGLASSGATLGGGSTFVYAPQYSTASPGEAQRFAQAVGPSITRWQQDRRLLGAG